MNLTLLILVGLMLASIAVSIARATPAPDAPPSVEPAPPVDARQRTGGDIATKETP